MCIKLIINLGKSIFAPVFKSIKNQPLWQQVQEKSHKLSGL